MVSGWPGALPRAGNRQLARLDEDSDFAAYRRSLAFLVGLGTQASRLCPAHNETAVPPEMLAQVATAFQRIAAGTVQPERQADLCVYRFDGFGVVLPGSDLSIRQSSMPSVCP
jgi:hypothetical protein